MQISPSTNYAAKKRPPWARAVRGNGVGVSECVTSPVVEGVEDGLLVGRDLRWEVC